MALVANHPALLAPALIGAALLVVLAAESIGGASTPRLDAVERRVAAAAGPAALHPTDLAAETAIIDGRPLFSVTPPPRPHRVWRGTGNGVAATLRHPDQRHRPALRVRCRRTPARRARRRSCGALHDPRDRGGSCHGVVGGRNARAASDGAAGRGGGCDRVRGTGDAPGCRRCRTCWRGFGGCGGSKERPGALPLDPAGALAPDPSYTIGRSLDGLPSWRGQGAEPLAFLSSARP